MILNLKDVFLNDGEKIKASFMVELKPISLDGIYPFDSDASVDATAENKLGFVSLTLDTSFVYSRPCDRCGKAMKKEQKFSFNHRLVAGLSDSEDDDYIEVPDFELELDDLVVSDILLDLPGKYLCSEDCKGLCPDCGCNLNDTECSCRKGNVDPRLEILKQLID
ncbi:MAG: DUF177 domain-containing protein [Clostridia bacterium]|nr:DUF177 domain-containing protein [Clostridia bacterium]